MDRGFGLLQNNTGEGQQNDWVSVTGFVVEKSGFLQDHKVLLDSLSKSRDSFKITTISSTISPKLNRVYAPLEPMWRGEPRAFNYTLKRVNRRRYA